MNVYSCIGKINRLVHKKLHETLGDDRFKKIKDISANENIILKDGTEYEIQIKKIK